MNITLKFKFLERVKSKINEDEMIITAVQIKADARVMYICLCKDGNWKQFNEFELEYFNVNNNSLGFNINFTNYDQIYDNNGYDM